MGERIHCRAQCWISYIVFKQIRKFEVHILDSQYFVYKIRISCKFLNFHFYFACSIGNSIDNGEIEVHPQNVRFQNVRFLNVRFQNAWNVRFTKRQVYKTSGLQNVRSTKCQVYKTSGLQNVRLQKNPYIFCNCGSWKSAGSVAAMLAGKVMAVFYSLF